MLVALLLWPYSLSAKTPQPLKISLTYPTIAAPLFFTTHLPIVTDKPKRVRSTNCVVVVRAAGYLVPQSKDGYARTIPVTSTKLPPEGQLVVMKTAESSLGHVFVGKVVDGKIISVIDSVGSGRVIDPDVYQGYI